MNNIIRESKNRTRSERLIDRQLSRGDLAVEPVKKQKISEEKSEPAKISSSEAFEKIKKSLNDPSKVAKAVQILRNYLKKYWNRFSSSEIIECIKKISEFEYLKILPINGLLELLEDIETYYEIEHQDKLFLLNFRFISESFNSLYTDDSAEFHKALKKIDEKLECLSADHQLTEFYGKGLRILKIFIHKPWCRSSIMLFMQKVYRKIELFKADVQNEITDLLDSKAVKVQTENIFQIGEASHSVTDNRDQILTINSLDSWSCRQSGLNEKFKIT